MTFKSEQVEKELYGTSVFLIQMAEDMDFFSREISGLEICVTRVLEPIVGDSGVHEDGRAFDVRDEHNGKRLYTDEQVLQICSYMNAMYKRNDGKLTCISHKFKGGPLHFHVQIAALTNTYSSAA